MTEDSGDLDLSLAPSLDELAARLLAELNTRLQAAATAVVEFAEGRRVVRALAGEIDGLATGAPHRDAGTSISTQIRLLNGETYGALWATRGVRGAQFAEADSVLMARAADSVARQIEADRSRESRSRELRARIEPLLSGEGLTMLFQPIVDLVTGEWKGCESLARFTVEPRRTPDVWFAEAWLAGLGEELELVAVRKALEALPELPETMYVAINVSPETIVRPELARILEASPPDRVVIEVTEHAIIEDYDLLRAALEPLRAKGFRLAIDDAGSGYSSMSHIIKMRPDIIKLDGTVTNNILQDHAQHALTKMMVLFAGEIGARVVAEVVETAEHAGRLRELAVHTAQGWYFSKPKPSLEIATEAPKVP